MAQSDDLKRFGINTGMNGDDAYEDVDKEGYYLSAKNLRNTGTKGNQLGYNTNLEDLLLLTGSLLPGINNVIGGGKFDTVGKVLGFRYNSAGNNQMILYDANKDTYTTIYTDLTNSAGQALLPLDPQNEVLAILINQTYVIFWAKNLEVGYFNLNTLVSGGYGTVLAEDFSLLKPPCLPPPTGTYGSDMGQPANYLYGLLPQFNAQYVNADFNYTAWSTWSKRIVPYQQNTPIGGADVTKNNYIIVSVNIGSIRTATLNIGCRFGLQIFSTIKSVDRAYIVALPHTSVDVSTEIYEAYNPTTNLYSFAFYNNNIAIPIDPNETDLAYDYIWPANSGALLNGNIAALGDWTTLYKRPATSINVAAIGYNPNIDIPANTNPDALRATGSNPGSSGSGAGDHRRIMSISIGGLPATGDNIITVMADIRDANNTQPHNYIVPSSQNGNLAAVVASLAAVLPSSSYVFNSGLGTYTITFIGDPYFGLVVYNIQLNYVGATVANSIPTILDNTNYQLALSYRDKGGRYFPLEADNTFLIATPSYAQVSGQAVEIAWKINTLAAPTGAVDYQWLITNPPVNKVLDTLATLLNYIGTWNAQTNTPTLAVNSGTVGDTYQVTTPSNPSDPTNYHNLGTGVQYDTGQYVTYNGQSWDVLQKDFGDLTSTGNIIAFSLNPLKLFNDQYAAEGVSTILSYDFAPGDRCTLHYYLTGTTKTFINNPCVNLSVLGYDAGTNIVKIEKSATFNIQGTLADKNTFLRLYSPALQGQTTSTVQSTTVWFEIGERFTITNGNHDVLSGNITDGGAYYKTRQFDDALNPYSEPPISVLATDLNYSDFYVSAFSSFGRPRTYSDVLENTEQKASIITSEPYILGSKINGLNRFYPERIYGEGPGQTSSSYDAIQIMEQRGQELVVIQGLDVFYIPVNEAYTVLNDELTGQSISSKLLNNGRYAAKQIGIGTAKESFWRRYDRMGFIDPYKSEPYEMTLSDIDPISGKMSKFFKSIIQPAYQAGKKLHQFYNDYYEEVVLAIQATGGILTVFPFDLVNWNPFDSYVIAPGDITATPNGSHSTASYDNTTGDATYTPTTNYVGNDAPTFTFNKPGGGTITKNSCLNWTASDTVVDLFAFMPLINQPLSTVIPSNTILVNGNTGPVAITITGGEMNINNTGWTSSPGIVNAGDTVQIRQTSSATLNTETDTVLSIGTPPTTGTFAVTTIEYGNVAIVNQPYQRNNCGAGESGTTVNVSIAANTYTSSISQADADLQATNVAQAIANSTGTCLVNSTLATLLVDYEVDTAADLCAYVKTTGLTESGLIVTSTLESPSGPLQLPGSVMPANCYVLSSDKLTSGSPAWRFGFNLAYFIAKYTGTLTSIVFEIRGRSASAALISGAYDARDISEGTFVRTGSTGATQIGVSGAVTVPGTFTSNIGNGANGTVGIGVGSPWATFTYDFTANTVSIVTY